MTAMSRRGPFRKSGSQETRTRILNKALEMFRERGFDQTTMRQIAAASGMALGAAYYYFPSKEALVMAFYQRAQDELEPLVIEALGSKSLEHGLRDLLDVKFNYFRPNRSLLGALSRHIDPHHPLSPFSDKTRPVRDRDIAFFARVIEGASVRIPSDLKPHLPHMLWLYQMGLFLFWVYDRSPEQVRTAQLVEKSLGIVVFLIKFSALPFFRPVRKRVVDLLLSIYSEPPSSEGGKE